MRNKKVYIVLLVILVVFFVVMFLIFGLNNIRSAKDSATIIVGDSTVWSYDNKKWLNLTTPKSIDRLNWKKFNVFVNNENMGKYSLWHDDKWYAFDDEKNAVLLEGTLFAYRSNFDMRIVSFEESEIDDRTYVDYVLEENNLSLSSKFTASYKTSIDFDNDGVNEDFYLISNAFPLDFDPELIFSIVFMVKNEKVYYLYNDISEHRALNGCKPFFTSFLDVDNDKYQELILSCAGYSTSNQVDMLYKFNKDDDAFKIVISNQ